MNQLMIQKFNIARKSRLNQTYDDMDKECSNHDCENCTKADLCFVEKCR